MRLISIALVAAVFSSFSIGCASAPPPPPKSEPVMLTAADFRPPPSELEMDFTPSERTPASLKRRDEGQMTAPRMVSQER